MFSLLPWRQTDCVFDLTGESLAGMGVRFLMADLDNTLIPYCETAPTDALRAWLDDLTAHGVTLFLLSNSRKPDRARAFSQALGIDYLGHAGKPRRGGYLRAMADHGVTAQESAMVGDQIFTDTLGANRAGVRSILVEPIVLRGNPGRYLRYWAEWPMRYLSRARRWQSKEESA